MAAVIWGMDTRTLVFISTWLLIIVLTVLIVIWKMYE